MSTRNTTDKRSLKQIIIIGTEVWKDVVGYEGYYQVSNFGRVKSLARIVPMIDGRKYRVSEKLLKPKWDERYESVVLSKSGVEESKSVHRIVLEAFRGPCLEGMECRHLNGRGWDNRVKNLRWGTSKQQAQDRARHGTSTKGCHGTTHKLTGMYPRIIRLRESGMKIHELAEMFDVAMGTIYYVLRVSRKRLNKGD